jgi:methyl-accepting chemotaxis protein-1 (serine sensor receptor)
MVNQSGQALTEIMASVHKLSATVQEIDIACNQQSRGVDLVAQAMTKVDAVLQENSIKTRKLSTTAQQLPRVAAGVTNTLSRFVFEGGSSSSVMTVSAPPDDLEDSLNEVKDWASSSCFHRVLLLWPHRDRQSMGIRK